MLQNTRDNNLNLQDFTIKDDNKKVYNLFLFICLFVFLSVGFLFAIVYGKENKWIIFFPLSTIIIILLVAWYMNNMKKRMTRVWEYVKICEENKKTFRQLLYYDSLTGLPNRKMILDEVDNMIGENLCRFFLIYFDMDDFKKINETAGYSVGDEILRKVAGRWSGIKKDTDILGHIGGDEFSLLVKEPMSRSRLIEYIDEFHNAIMEPVNLYGKEYFVSASFGIAEYPVDGKDGIELFKSSYIAMNTAKSSSTNHIQFYTYEMQLEILKRLQIENGLLYSVQNNELYMVYQPMYHCDTRTLRGFEALIRWRYPGMDPLSPSQFIPIAEETGIIVDMGKWIINEVLTKFMEFQRRYQIRTIVSVNISVVQMIDPSFVSMIREVLEETGYDGRYLELEITESVLISYPEHIIETIRQLREMGIRIALDDFGTGYASLNYLQMLPINILKIDRSFIDKVGKDNTMSKIVAYIINLAHQLEVEVVAEGVEYEEQLNFLCRNGCDYIQGFLLSKPLDAELVEQQLISYGR